MAHHIQFGNMKVILVEPGNIKRMLMGKALSFPINRVLINGKQTDITEMSCSRIVQMYQGL
jgi:hypothetical protein